MHLPTFWCDGESSFCIVKFGERIGELNKALYWFETIICYGLKNILLQKILWTKTQHLYWFWAVYTGSSCGANAKTWDELSILNPRVEPMQKPETWYTAGNSQLCTPLRKNSISVYTGSHHFCVLSTVTQQTPGKHMCKHTRACRVWLWPLYTQMHAHLLLHPRPIFTRSPCMLHSIITCS
jgi:hypothetical protein